MKKDPGISITQIVLLSRYGSQSSQVPVELHQLYSEGWQVCDPNVSLHGGV